MPCAWRPKKSARARLSVFSRRAQLTRSGTLLRLRRGYEIIARRSGSPGGAGLARSIVGLDFFLQGRRFFRKWPQQFPVSRRRWNLEARFRLTRPTSRRCGRNCLSWVKVVIAGARRCAEHLGVAALRGLARHPFRVAVIDGMDDSSLSRGKLLGAAAALSRHLRQEFPGASESALCCRRAKAAVVANLAVVLAGKVPVGLNFTSGRAALERAQEIAGLKTAISANAFHQAVDGFSVAGECRAAR